MTQNGGKVTATTLTLENSGAVSLTKDNEVKAVGGEAQKVTLNTATALEQKALTATGKVDLDATGALTQSGELKAEGQAVELKGSEITLSKNVTAKSVKLEAGTTQSSGIVTADEVILAAAGKDVSLDKDNAIKAVGGEAQAVTLNTTTALEQKKLTATGKVDLDATGALTQSGALAAAGQEVELKGSAITLSQNVTAKSVKLESGTTQSGGIVTADEVILDAAGKAVSLDKDNAIKAVGGSAKAVTLNTTTALDFAGVSVAEKLKATASSLTDSGQNTAKDVELSVSGDATLDNANDFDTLTATVGSMKVVDKDDLRIVKIDAGTDARIIAAKALDVNGAVTAGGNVLLQSDGGAVKAIADVTGKNVTVNAKSNVEITAKAKATEDLYVTAGGNISLPKAPEAGATLALVAGGRIDAASPKGVTIYTRDRTGENVTDADASSQFIDSHGDVNRSVKGDATIGVKAPGKVDLDVSGTLTVGSAASGGKELKVTEVLAEGGTDETTVAAASGATSVSGISAGKDVDIAAKAIGGTSISAGGDVNITTTGGDYSVKTTNSGGNTTLDVAGAVQGVESIDAKSDATLGVKGAITAEEITAGGALVIQGQGGKGASGDLEFATMKAKSVEATTGSIAMGNVDTGDATFDAHGSITDNGSEVVATTLAMTASGDIGSSGSPIVTKTGTLKTISGRNVYLEETSSGTVGVGTISADNRLEFAAPNLGKDGRLTPSGDGRIKAGAGGALLDVAGHIGDLNDHITIELKNGGKLELRSGSLNLNNEMWKNKDDKGYLYVIVDAPGFEIEKWWEGYNKNGGSPDQKIPGLVIVNGQVLEGNPDLLRAIHRAEAFTIETPELKSKQGVFGSPVFIHTDMDVSEAASIGSIDYLQMDWGKFNPIENPRVMQWLRPKGLLGSFLRKRENPMGTVDLYTKDYTDFESRKPAEKEPEAKPDRSEKEKAKKEAKLREKADAAAQEAANREARDASPDVSSSASGPASAPGA